MRRMIALVAMTTASFAGLSWLDSPVAEAGHHRHGGYYYGGQTAYGYGYGQNYGGYGGYTQYWINNGAGYGGGYGPYGTGYRAPVYHDTSHWDYHPTTVVPHGNHYHVIPGHYDWHQTGHWHN